MKAPRYGVLRGFLSVDGRIGLEKYIRYHPGIN